MTEKRFYVDKSGDFRDTKTGNIIVDFGYSFNGMECKMILDLLNSLNDENERLKQQRKVYDKFLDLNDLEIEWQFLCDADKCNEKEDMDCRDCKYLGVLE